MKTVNVLSATRKQLDWLVAKIEGRVLREPVYATPADVERLKLPFTMFEVSYANPNWEDRCTEAHVHPIVVTRYGVDLGCSAPSISFRDNKGRPARGSVENYYFDKAEAELEAKRAVNGSFEDYHPTTDPIEAYKIILREGIGTYRECESKPTGRYEKRQSIWEHTDGTEWEAVIGLYHVGQHEGECQGLRISGPTPFVAAMRCHVVANLGETAEVPDELV